MKHLAPGLLIAVLLASCASTRMRNDDRLALYRSHAGQPVRNFQYSGTIVGWTSLGERSVAIWTKPDQAYLLEVSGPCPDLEYAQALSVSNQAGLVSAKLDKVLPRGGGVAKVPCQIREIRPLDTGAIRQAETMARDEVQPSGT